LHSKSSREGTGILALEVIVADAQTSVETWERQCTSEGKSVIEMKMIRADLLHIWTSA
jgi:hypothetical protein